MLGIYSNFPFCPRTVLSKIGKYKISNSVATVMTEVFQKEKKI